MPYQIQPYNYQSTFVPTDLGVIQRGLEQRQGRYDSANQAWAQTKMALYDDPSYDPSVKEEVVKKVEGNFDNLYKSYNGDMGAAVSDLTQMIGGIRKDPYFSLNKVALEKQKEYEALKKAYGAKGIEFKGMPQGLRDPNTGKLRSQEEFAPEVVQDLDRQGLASKIWEQSLEQVSREGGLRKSKDGKFYESVTTSGKGIFGQLDSKLPGVLNEYLQTPEGKLHMRIVMEKEGISDPSLAKGKIENWLKDIGQSRVAPPSYNTDRINNPDYVAGGGPGAQPPPQDIFSAEQSTVKTGGEKMFSSGSDILDKAGSKELTPEKDIAYQKIKRVSSKPQFIEMRQDIYKTLETMKANKGDYIKVGELTYSEHDRKYNPKLVAKIDAYNDLLKAQLDLEANATDYKHAQWTHVDRNKAFRTGGKAYETYADVTMKNTVDEIRRIGLDGFVYEDSPFANKKKYEDEDYKTFSNLKDAQFTFDTKNGMFAIKINTDDGKSHIAIPKSLTSAVSLARAYGHPEAIQAAVTSNIDFISGTPRYYQKIDGVPTAFNLPENITVNQNPDGTFLVKNEQTGDGFIAMDKYTVARELNLIPK